MEDDSRYSRAAASSNRVLTDQVQTIARTDAQEGSQTHIEASSFPGHRRADTAEEDDSEIRTQSVGVTYTKYPRTNFQVFMTCTAPPNPRIVKRRREIHFTGTGCG
ncbi:hypothetical protein I302_101058 [Kwoniella bestiolae CBS 10118]|uniref:Uncharacterized protein n=1 Tax=Kwoniella bestiolae CBS 10118 TaxID=1296100 RepID=A0A1B9G6V0_9TREE|nr:hypothetical protein I302_04434 [Kwoniella bestiolae CBS 10118]OCF26746.1 hypothetical protein I302_04434 [Kwoniella bestiolae CBS 10118]